MFKVTRINKTKNNVFDNINVGDCFKSVSNNIFRKINEREAICLTNILTVPIVNFFRNELAEPVDVEIIVTGSFTSEEEEEIS